ncbi:MAG: hypothetical protein ABL903_11080 [Methylococcales bacterium]
MQPKRNKSLITKVLIIGLVIALLSYLFHPGVGQFALSLNGEPVAEPLVRFAAFPSFLVVLFLTGLLTLLLFFGIGVMMFIAALLFALALSTILLPYFWPMLVVIFLIIALTSVSKG